MSSEIFRMRPFLVGEVAQVAGDPRETIRTRLKSGVFGFESNQGWKRFSDFETILISVHARLMRQHRDAELAEIGMLLVGKMITDEWKVDDKGVPYFAMETFERSRFMIFWRDSGNNWHAEIAETPEELQIKTDERFDQSYLDEPAFTLVNIRTLFLQTILAMTKVEIAKASAKAGKK